MSTHAVSTSCPPVHTSTHTKGAFPSSTGLKAACVTSGVTFLPHQNAPLSSLSSFKTPKLSCVCGTHTPLASPLLLGWLFILPQPHGDGVPGLIREPSYLSAPFPEVSPSTPKVFITTYLITPKFVSSLNLFSELQKFCIIQLPSLTCPTPNLSFWPPFKTCFTPSVLLSKRDHQPGRCLNHEPGNHLTSSLSSTMLYT